MPIGIASTFAAAFVLRREPTDRSKKFDLIGFLTIASGLGALLLALEEGSSWGWTSYRVLGLLFFGTNMLLLWVVIERQVEDPLLDLRVFRHRTYVVSLVMVALFITGLSSMLFYLPQFLQSVQGHSPWEAGLIVLPQALVLMVTMPAAGKIYDLIGARWPGALGMLLAGSGLLFLSGLNTDMPTSDVIIGEMLVAAGMGIGMMPVMTGGLSALPAEVSGSGSAFNTLSQRAGQSFGLALLSALIVADRTQSFADRSGMVDPGGADADPSVRAMARQGAGGLLGAWQRFSGEAQSLAYSNAFLIAGVVLLVAVGLAFVLPTGRPEQGDGDKPVAH